ncbi:hypothetical protein OHB05_41090 [Streptomyces sp. NBC_00638]|nr:hypothetical protein [Streptomyces sp. NBC_00638]MCX5008921.1 hypothetical protein [Streptomyces sp. NBC_00638]
MPRRQAPGWSRAVTVYRKLAAARPDAFQPNLEKSLQFLSWLQDGQQ